MSLMADDCILETTGLVKEFRGFVAVNGVNLKVKRGHIHALIWAERRRQDHLLQPAHQVSRTDTRHDPLQRRGHHARITGAHCPARHRPLFPDFRRVSRI
jgi:hypothetical protein